MHIFYTHGLGGSREAQPEIEEVFAPLGHRVIRVAVPRHDTLLDVATMLSTITFGELCLLIDRTANIIIESARDFSPEEYTVIGDSLGGFISAVAAQRDAHISHCLLLACSGDLCNAVMNLNSLLPGLGYLAGMWNLAGNGGLKIQAHKAMAGQSTFQEEFERVNTFHPGRRAKIRRLLILSDKRDPVMPASACWRFASGVKRSRIIMAYNEGRHHPIGKTALQKYAVPFFQDKPLTMGEALQQFFRRGLSFSRKMLQ